MSINFCTSNGYTWTNTWRYNAQNMKFSDLLKISHLTFYVVIVVRVEAETLSFWEANIAKLRLTLPLKVYSYYTSSRALSSGNIGFCKSTP